ncbi:MAG: hypothetical protein C0631_10065 [Sedimenticola sp.]|nr:MAG: hypothetical protein C0631_10065 [Sedimenticola sp.]
MIRHIAIALLLSLTLTACGFQLRGSTPLPASLNPLLIQGIDIESPIGAELAQLLGESGVTLTRQTSAAAAILRLHNHRVDRRVLSVDSNGKVAEYELHEMLRFELVSKANAQLIPAQSVGVVRAYVNTEEQVLGKQQEEEMLRQDMQRDLADQLLRRLQTQLK